jgi:hypothetical protein
MTQPKSAYEIWLELGNTGSKEDFLNSLKGADAQDSALPGPAGTTATIEIGEVLTGEAGTAAAVQNVGTDTAAKLNFTIPRGEKGVIGDVNLPGPLDAEIITCNIEDLQSTIDNLARFLNKNITIKTNPGIFTQDIYLQNFFGYGSITLIGSEAIAETHQLRSINVFNCLNGAVNISGFDLLADAVNAPIWQFSVSVNNNSAAVHLSHLNSTKGVKTNGYNQGICTYASRLVHITNSNISNKNYAINMQSGITMTSNIQGTNNRICFGTFNAGIHQRYGTSTITGTTLHHTSEGCFLI